MADAVSQAIFSQGIKYLADALKDEVSYLCCYSRNVPRLENEVEKLNATHESVEQDVRARRNNLEIIVPEVDSWLKDVEKVKRESDRIRDAAEEVRRSCLCKWVPVLHYSLSRATVKTTEDAIKLRNNAPPFEISHPRIPAEIEPIPAATSEKVIKSRDEIEEQIMNALEDQSVYLIGLSGMGGVGKTTMAKKIEKVVREKKAMFEHVVMAVVSQQPDLLKIQKQIAEGLGLTLSEEFLENRAKKLHERLMAEKSILIILDDVWEKLNLEELGIPSKRSHVGCKIIITSRNMRALTSTNSRTSTKIFQLDVLNDEESWILFKDNTGSAVDSSDLNQIAKDVTRECKGLPLALKVVSCALRDSGKSSWENALLELRKSMPMNVPGVVKEVYQPLLFSVDQLESEEARYFFLLCCLFPEDFNISLEELVKWEMGLRIFQSLKNFTVVRNRIETILNNLISRSLLIDCKYKSGDMCVKMHDVIRDVGIWMASKERIEFDGKIASEEKHVFMVSHGEEEWPMRDEGSYGNYTCISLLFSRQEVAMPKTMDCRRLEFLYMGYNKDFWLNIPETFFNQMRSLRVLRGHRFISLPSSVGQLNNLRSLILIKCRCMFGTTSVIVKLINLEILSLESCEVDVLPKEFGGLVKLRQLHISYCDELRIAYGVISGLVGLEELIILGSFYNWEAEANGTVNAYACLAELDCLNHLTTLNIEICNPSVIPIQMPPWVQKVKRYSIAISLGDETKTPLGDWFYGMVSDSDYLNLTGPSYTIVVKRLIGYLGNRNYLKYLSLSKLTNVQCLGGDQQNNAIFPMLKSLDIFGSDNLQEIFKIPPPAGSFEALEEITLVQMSGLTCLWQFPTEKLYLSNLKSVKLIDCENLAYLFSLSIIQSLSRLEKLAITMCPSMEEIFKKEDGEMEINKIEFPKLDSLQLTTMESLCCLSKGTDRIEAPALRILELEDLPSMIGIGVSDIHQQCFFMQPFVGNFNGLQILRMERIHKVKCLFSPSFLSGFSNLQELNIEDCSELEEVIGNDENVGEAVLLPNLQQLKLFSLPNILTFCCTRIELPSLEQLHIDYCPMMERFSRGFSNTPSSGFHVPFFSKEVYFPKLKSLELRSLKKIATIFSPPTFRDLTNLKKLVVENCAELEEVIAKEEVEGPTNKREILSPRLEEFRLCDLPKIHRFYFMKHCLEFPSLKKTLIYKCPMMERFSL